VDGKACWLCRCQCGTEKTIDSGHLGSGDTKSCGCLIRDTSKALILALHQEKMVPNAVVHNSDGTSSIIIVNRKGETFHCFIDTADYPQLKNYRWYVDKGNRTHYVRGSLLSGEGSRLKMHQLLSGAKGVDHRNCNGLDNSRSNLRRATRAENGRNRRKWARKMSSQYLGVFLNRSRATFYASIRVNKKPIHLGTFTSEIEAAKAYNEAAQFHFGEFARLNEIPTPLAA